MNETFYGGFYGFQSAPFHITPDPTLLFPTETHRAALGAIEYGITAGKGFIVVTGEVGVGKTTVLRVCLDGLDPTTTKIIYLFSPALSTTELYATLLEEFDVTLPASSNAADMLRILQRTLLAVHHSGMQVVLAVDEAQQMPEATLESLRILSNLETHKSKLLQIILVGQPELEAVLAKHSMRQLAQRVAVRARIRKLTFRQSCRYIAHRTRCAGRVASRPLFTTPALLYLAFVAGGVPRSINICCDNALINGYGHAAERISLGIVREACKAMKFRSPLRRVAALAAAVMVLVGLFVTANALLRHFYVARAESVSATGPAQPAADIVAVTPPGRKAAQSEAAKSEAAQSVVANRQPASAPTPDHAPAAAADAPSEEGSAGSTGATGPRDAPAAPPSTDALVAGAAQAPKPPSAAESTPSAPPAQGPDPPAALAAPRAISTRAVSRWLVRDGDTVYKACRATYGACDPRTLHAVIAINPRLDRDATIHSGEILLLPKHPPASAN